MSEPSDFPAPVSDAKVLRTLVLLDLESHPPSAGIDQVTVVADPVPTRTLQFSLLERAMPSPEQLSTLLARLTVLMGGPALRVARSGRYLLVRRVRDAVLYPEG